MILKTNQFHRVRNFPPIFSTPPSSGMLQLIFMEVISAFALSFFSFVLLCIFTNDCFEKWVRKYRIYKFIFGSLYFVAEWLFNSEGARDNHSSSNMSDDSFKASSKTVPPHTSI